MSGKLQGYGAIVTGAGRGIGRAIVERLTREGVPAGVPRVISEYGFSAYSGRAMAQIESGLLMADIVGQFLQRERGQRMDVDAVLMRASPSGRADGR